ncbi:MFS transporter [Streptomyces sp. S.PB5]|uniref:MFS transporter n=1 Tax=Streptomyces sp. S.PB5 TaxID=3020844 RepID=UPI0025B15515|nr:MFS transporter [Streptomyces sp. S.PB5]MDN3027567.1 MFS transporter [Streptomyces sp. S.PB5]
MAATTEARAVLTPNRVHPGISRRLTLLLAVATGAIAANLYYAQPLLDVIARSLGTSDGAAGAIVTVTQLGFAAGLVFVLPLADIVKRRSLLTALLLLDAAALTMVGLAPDLGVALAAYAVLGLANVAAQLLVPAAAQLADDAQRGRAVATVISGPAHRHAARADHLRRGDRIHRLAPAVPRGGLPDEHRQRHPAPRPAHHGRRHPAPRPVRRGVALHPPHLPRHPRAPRPLRVRSADGALGFAGFSIFWSTAALQLSRAPFHHSPAVIGLFGLLGAAGAMAANLTGRVKRHTHPMPTVLAVALIALAYVVLLFSARTLVGIVAGIVILDIGVQGLHVLNQRIIYDIDAAARNRLNSICMTFYFLGGALGSAMASFVWTWAGWTCVCLTGLGVTAFAVVLRAFTSLRDKEAVEAG